MMNDDALGGLFLVSRSEQPVLFLILVSKEP